GAAVRAGQGALGRRGSPGRGGPPRPRRQRPRGPGRRPAPALVAFAGAAFRHHPAVPGQEAVSSEAWRLDTGRGPLTGRVPRTTGLGAGVEGGMVPRYETRSAPWPGALNDPLSS